MQDKSRFTVLIRMPNWLGDCVMAMPAVRHLADALPKSRIFLSGREQFRDLFLAQERVAGFVPAPRGGLGGFAESLAGAGEWVSEAGGVDLGVLFTNSFSTALWLWRTGAKIRLGYNRDCRRLFLTHPVPYGGMEAKWHYVQYCMWLAKCAEAAAFETEKVSRRHLQTQAEYMAPSVRVADAARSGAASLLAESGVTGGYAVIAPASAYGEVKDWPASHWRRLVEMINSDLGLPVVVTGGAGQSGVCGEIADGQKSAVNLAGKTGLDTFAGLLAGAGAFVGGDSGGAHLAAALGVPTVVIFGVTDPSRTSQGGRAVKILGGLPDGGLKLSTDEARRKAKAALAAITPEEVLASIKTLK